MHFTEQWIKHLQRKSRERGFLLLLLVEMHPLDAYFGTVVLNQTSGYICRINAVCLHDEYPVAFMKLQGKGIQALCSSAVYCVSFQYVPSMTFRDQECISTQQNLGWRGSFFFFPPLFFRFFTWWEFILVQMTSLWFQVILSLCPSLSSTWKSQISKYLCASVLAL